MPNINVEKDKNTSQLDEIQALLEKNQIVLDKFQKWLVWNRVFVVLKILFIVVPIVLGIIYLPPLIQNAFGPYAELLGNVKGIPE